MASAGRVPLDLQLTVSAPLAIRAYRRRFFAPCTNLQEAGPDDYISIYPDTSTPGSFLDPESTYLMFDFEVINNQFCVDFADWGVEGVGGAIIQDWRVFNQGTVLEEILDYGTVASTMANIEGAYQSETHLFFSSMLKGGFQEEYHRNFIKPPMVDSSKNIMFGANPFGIGFSGMNTNSNTQYGNKFLSSGNNVILANQLVGSGTRSSMIQRASDGTNLEDFYGTLGAGGESITTLNGEMPFSNTLNTDTLPSWTSYTGTLKDVAKITPMDFPDLFSPNMVDIVDKYISEYGSINKPQVMANLCNVKCYPIGMIPSKNAWNDAPHGTVSTNAYDVGSAKAAADLTDNAGFLASAPVPSNPKYRICYRPYSGIFGKGATKMLATSMISPHQMYINIHLASAAVALNVSADPCRRISGTIRDYIRNVGTANNHAYGSDTYLMVDDANNAYITGSDSSYAPGYGPFHSIPLANGKAFYNASVSTIFSEASASGRSLVLGCTTAGVKTLQVTGQSTGGIPPTPQYMLTLSPWKYKLLQSNTGAPIVNYANENQVFYGTYLKASVPQVARIFDLSITGAATPGVPNTGAPTPYSLTYRLSNIGLVGDQLILPNEVAADILEQAEAGQFNVHTNSVRTYQLQVQNSSTQSIICPFKVNMAKRIFFVFQNNVVRNAQTGFLYDSNCGLNPFALVEAGEGNTKAFIPSTGGASEPKGFTGSGTAIDLYGVGWTNPLRYVPTPLLPGSSNMSAQLRVGNDFYPQQPLTSMTEISAEFVKALEGWSNPSFSPEVDGNVCTYEGKAAYDCLQGNKYTTAFIPTEILDDQTITGNSDMVPLYGIHGAAAADASSGIAGAGATRNSALNGHNFICPRGYCLSGMFKSPSSRFILGFSLRPFKASDGTDGGVYLGNNTITLLLNGAVGLSGKGQNYRVVGVIPHRVVMRYSPGGQIVWAY